LFLFVDGGIIFGTPNKVNILRQLYFLDIADKSFVIVGLILLII
jgi:hypothetical protein